MRIRPLFIRQFSLKNYLRNKTLKYWPEVSDTLYINEQWINNNIALRKSIIYLCKLNKLYKTQLSVFIKVNCKYVREFQCSFGKHWYTFKAIIVCICFLHINYPTLTEILAFLYVKFYSSFHNIFVCTDTPLLRQCRIK